MSTEIGHEGNVESPRPADEPRKGSRHLRHMKPMIEGMMRAFDLSGFGAFVTDPSLNALSCNRRAQEHASAPIIILNGELRTRLFSHQETLERLVTSAAGQKGNSCHAILDHDGSPYRHMLMAAPLGGWDDGSSARPMERISTRQSGALHIVLWFRAEESDPKSNCDLLQRVFHLTPAESRLAAELAAGTPLAQAAANIGVTLLTARDRLKTIFSKTHTARQAELVRLLSRIL